MRKKIASFFQMLKKKSDQLYEDGRIRAKEIERMKQLANKKK